MILKPLAWSLFLLLVSSVASHAQNQQRKRQPGWPCTGTVDPAYVRTAEATGGVVVLLKPTEIAGSAADVAASKRHEEVVLRAGGQLDEGVYDFYVPLDSTIRSAYFFVSMQCLEFVSVNGPSGEELRTDAPGVEYHEFAAVRLFTVPEPAPGPWKVRVAGRGYLSVVVKADTDLRLSGVTFGARGVPLKREPQRLEVGVMGEAGDIGFSFVSATSGPIESVLLELVPDGDSIERTYAGEVTPPVADFRVAVTGTDAKGFRFQRVDERLQVVGR